MPGPRSTTWSSTRCCATHASTRTVAAGGDHAIAFSTTLAMARSSSAASARTRGSVSSTSTSTRSAWVRPAERDGQHLVETDVAHHELERAGLQPAHVEQVADEVVEPVSALVDGLEQLPGGGGREVDVALQQAADRRLDRRQRRPQVVRHRREQRGAQLVGLRQPGGPLGVGPQLALLDRDRHLAGERARGPRGRRRRGPAPQDQHLVAVERDHDVGVVGSLDRDVARTAPAPSSRRHRLAEHGDVVGVERQPQLVDQLRERVVRRRQRAAQRGERLRFGARPRRVGGAARRGRDEQAHDARRRAGRSRARRGSRPRRS